MYSTGALMRRRDQRHRSRSPGDQKAAEQAVDPGDLIAIDAVLAGHAGKQSNRSAGPYGEGHARDVREGIPAKECDLEFAPDPPHRRSESAPTDMRLPRRPEYHERRNSDQSGRHQRQRVAAHACAEIDERPRRECSETHRTRLIEAARQASSLFGVQGSQHPAGTRDDELAAACGKESKRTAPLEDSRGCSKLSQISNAAMSALPRSQVRRRTRKSVIGLQRKYRLVGSDSKPIMCACVALSAPSRLSR